MSVWWAPVCCSLSGSDWCVVLHEHEHVLTSCFPLQLLCVFQGFVFNIYIGWIKMMLPMELSFYDRINRKSYVRWATDLKLRYLTCLMSFSETQPTGNPLTCFWFCIACYNWTVFNFLHISCNSNFSLIHKHTSIKHAVEASQKNRFQYCLHGLVWSFSLVVSNV